MQYKIVEATNHFELEMRVNNWVAIGWEPSGGVTAVNNDGYFTYLQPLIKKGGDKPSAAPQPAAGAEA